MKYLKYFETEAGYASYKTGSDYVLPNVSYVVETKDVNYDSKKSFKLRAKYNATPDNLVAFDGASNITSLKVNGNSIKFEPAKNEITTFDVLGKNISLDMKTGEATFPESYLIKSPVSSWSFKAKDPNYVINENTYVCMLGMVNGMTTVLPEPFEEVMGNSFTTNDGVTLEVGGEFLNDINAQIQSGMQMGFTLCDMDMNSGTFVFIDTEHQTNVTTEGLSTYSFDSEGLHDVEIELADPDMKDMQFAETSLISIEIGDGITSIGDEAFLNCSSLTSITIPDSVTSIGYDAFRYCSGLTSVNIGSGVTSIDRNAFYDCSSLTSITCLAPTAPTIDSYTFYGVKNDGILKVPIESESNYETWMSLREGYLGYYGWNMEYFIPENAKIFEITYDVEENARQTEELFNLIYTNLGEENIKNNVYANTSVSVKEATGYDYISYSYEYSANSIFFFKIIEIDAYDDRISINFGNNVGSYHFSDNSYETKMMPV